MPGSDSRAMHRVLTTQSLENITHGVVDEALRIRGIQFLERECSRARACRRAYRGRRAYRSRRAFRSRLH